MPTLCDVNFLLAICYDAHIHHPKALNWLNQRDDLDLIICRNTQLGLLRLLTNSAVMGVNVCTLKQAWSIYDKTANDARFDLMAEPDGVESVLRQYTMSGQISPKLWQDAYLAAFARAGKLRLVTIDKGFRKFEGLQLTLLE